MDLGTKDQAVLIYPRGPQSSSQFAMKFLSLLGLVAVALGQEEEGTTVGVTTGQPVTTTVGGEKYVTKYDNVNVDDVLSNERLYKKYFHCLVNKGKCTPDGKELKDRLPEALQTDCAKCSEKQRAGAERVLVHLIENRPEDWAELEKIYDPEGSYRKKYRAEAEKRGIQLDEETTPPKE